MIATSTSQPTTPAPVPAPADEPTLVYDEVIQTRDVAIPFVPEIVTPSIERSLRKGRYERDEARLLRAQLRAGDRVLDLGAGLGMVSTIAARELGGAAVTSVEANPRLIPLIEETHRINGVGGIRLMNGVATPEAGTAPVTFYLRKDFWSSSMEPDSRPYIATADLPALPIDALIAETRPTIVCCDIEGGEMGLFDRADLSGVRVLILELHRRVYGEDGIARIDAAMAVQGFRPHDPAHKSTVTVYERPPAPAPGTVSPAPSRTDWPPADPRILIATCMKDEGPFILEWVAWHKAIGVTDIVVFSNDCTDGSDRLLDRLDAMGELTHLPNPATVMRSSNFQPVALAYAMQLRAFRTADFFISIDVDEFLTIRAGDGRLVDLFAATGPFDVLSVNELNHGSNRQQTFEPGWVTEQFPGHAPERPGDWKAHQGVKSIVRLSDRVAKIRNHRPDLRPEATDAIWLDGSGRARHELLQGDDQNGFDCRGSYDLAVLNHFALRSLDSYLMKMFRGDAVSKTKRVGQRYWRRRNHHADRTVDLSRGVAMARAAYRRFEADADLMALHAACCTAHRERIADLHSQPDYAERRDWVLREAW